MPRTLNRLKPLQVDRARKSGRFADGGGLYLYVGKEGRKSWLFRYVRGSKMTELGLGGLTAVPLVDARNEAAELRKVLAQGGDPKAHRDSLRRKAATQAVKDTTFKTCAERYIATHRETWKTAKQAAVWKGRLTRHAFPVIGDKRVRDVTVEAVMRILTPIWTTKPETASRVRLYIEKILDYARASDMREGDNPAEWKGNLEFRLAARKGKRAAGHHKALPYNDVPKFMRALAEQPSVAAQCMRLTILTAARTGEAIGARWNEFDLEEALWTIPAARMKMARDHRVPLSKQAVELLETLPRIGAHVFPGNGRAAVQPDGPASLSTGAMLMLLRRMGWADRTTTHGFRSAFKTWASERTAYADEISEAALAHAKGDKLAAAYNRGDVLEKRRRLMQDWANYCEKGGHAGARVVPMRAG